MQELSTRNTCTRPSLNDKWTATSEFGTYRLCEQRRFRQACASAQSRQNLCCSLIQAVSQEEPSDRKPDPWPLWMAGYAQLKFVMTECSKTQIRLTGLKWTRIIYKDKSPLHVNSCYKVIFTLAVDFPGPTGVIRQRRSIDHVTLSLGEVTDKQTSWLVNATFDLHHVMTMAV